MRLLLSIGALAALLIFAGCTGGVTSTTPAAPTKSDTLAQIAAAPAPSGVDATVWAQLKAELVRVLGARASLPVIPQHSPAGTRALLKNTSTPPAGEGSAAQLFYYPANAMLSWGYYCQGDYDQNGEVNIADLTPLAQHLGETSAGGPGTPFAPSSLGSVIDGDANGEINIGDVTPLGMNFGARVAGYRVYSSERADAHPSEPDAPNGPGTSWLTALPFAPGGPAPSTRRQLNLQVVPTYTLQYYWVRPYDGALDGAASNAVEVAQPPNSPPVAALTPFGNTATLAHIVWDASASRDLEGLIVKYEWDFDGDGVYEYDATAAASESGGTGIDPAKQDYYYYDPGTFSVGVRVTDGGGLTATATAQVTITQVATWHATSADEQMNKPAGVTSTKADGMLDPCALLDVGGDPALFFERLQSVDPDTQPIYDLCYIRADDALGQTWGEPHALGEMNARTQVSDSYFGAAAIVGGRPAAAYTYQTNDEHGQFVKSCAYYVRASDALGSNWPARKLLFESQDEFTGFAPREFVLLGDKLALVAGADAAGGMVSDFLLASDAVGSSWSEPYNTGASLDPATTDVIVAGSLLASAKYANNQDLLYNRTLDTAALDWTDPVLVDKLEKVGGRPEILTSDGWPAVVYYDDALAGLKYRRTLDAQGTRWGAAVVLTAEAAGLHMTAVVDGRPAVLFTDRIDGLVKLVAANDPQGRRWGLPSTITSGATISLLDPSYSYPARASFSNVSGMPAVAHIVSFEDEFAKPGMRLEYISYH